MLYFQLLMDETSSVFSESPFGTQPSTTPTSNSGKGPGRKGKKLLLLIIIIIILAAIAFGAMQLLGNNTETSDVTPTPTVEEFVMPTDEPTPTESEKDVTPTKSVEKTSTPTPTKAASSSSSSVDSTTKLDRADITILVQNGSGEAGVAKIMSDKLTGLGYKVSGTANADNFDYAQTVIQVKSTNKDFLPLLKKDLGTDYTIGTATSDYTGSGDAVVIIGKE